VTDPFAKVAHHVNSSRKRKLDEHAAGFVVGLPDHA
jgi:hypothetical protein